MRFGDDFNPVRLGRVAGFTMETLGEAAGAAGQQMHARVAFTDGSVIVLRAVIGEPLTIDVRQKIHDNGVTVRPATDREHFEAILKLAQHAAKLEETTHDCGEWRHGCRCGLCGVWIGDDETGDRHEFPPQQPIAFAMTDHFTGVEDTCDYVSPEGVRCGAHVGWGIPALHLRRCDDHADVADHGQQQ